MKNGQNLLINAPFAEVVIKEEERLEVRAKGYEFELINSHVATVFRGVHFAILRGR